MNVEQLALLANICLALVMGAFTVAAIITIISVAGLIVAKVKEEVADARR